MFSPRFSHLLSSSQDARITDAANEAKDNVRYLYTLDKFFSTLDKNNPVNISSFSPSGLSIICLFVECYCRKYSQSDECYSNDSQYLSILQFFRTYDIIIRENYQSNDQYMQTIYQKWKFTTLGYSKVSPFFSRKRFLQVILVQTRIDQSNQ